MKRKRKEENSVLKEYREYFNRVPPDKVIFHDISKNKLPPNTGENILYFDPMFGYGINKSAIVLQHIHEDIKQYQFSRVTHWARLKIKNK